MLSLPERFRKLGSSCLHLLLLFWLPSEGLGVALPEAGLVLHLDAGAIRNVADGASLVSGWPDISGNQNNATSATPPTYLADAGDGYPAVRFNGVDQYLQVTLPTANEASVFIVFAHQRLTLPANRLDTLISATGSGITLYLTSSRSTDPAPDTPSFTAVPGTGVTVQSWVNGHDMAQVSGDIFSGRYYLGTAVYTALPAREALLIGSRGTGGFNAGRNDIREMLIYNRALSEVERETVQRHLGLKYDMEVIWRPLDHPVESWPHVLGSQQFGTHYSFGESGISTVDYARATLRQGNRVVKFRLSNKYANEDGFTADPAIDSLVKLVRDQAEVRSILEMPLTDYLFWVASFSVPSWQNALDETGLKQTAQEKIYTEVYDLAAHLLATYSGTGKRFYLGNWEGDWMLAGNYRDNPSTIPLNRIQGMIDWANTRQRAIDDAKAAIPHQNVEVWFYLEMNKADWMRDGLPCVANSVIPAMPKLDMLSISSYSVHKDRWGGQRNRTLVHADLDLALALLNAKPDPTILGSRLIIGEYGWIYDASKYPSLEEFAAIHRDTARNFLSWQGGTLRFVLQWQFYNQATVDNKPTVSKEMNQIGPENDRRPLYHLHENFNRLMRRWVEDHLQRTGTLPSNRAYADQAAYLLDSGRIALSEYVPATRFDRYEAWRAAQFIDKAEAATLTISGPDADPYDTGLPNLLRYALGMRKAGMDPSRMPHIRWNGGAPVYAVPFDPVKADLRWRVQASTTLNLWPISLYDSQTDSSPAIDGWLEVSAAPFIDFTDPIFYRLNLELLP